MVKDLTVGKPLKKIFSIFAPMLLTTFFQLLYNVVDTMIVGKFVSSSALAAVGSTGNLNYLLISFIIGFASAEGVLVSVEFGKKDFERMKIYIANGIYVISVVGIIITLASAILCGKFLEILNTPEDIFDDAYTYFFIVVLGFPFSAGSNYFASLMSSVGNSKYPMIIGIVSTFVNLFLDLAFVLLFGLGVFGVAFATFIAQMVNTVIYFIVFKKNFPELSVSKKHFRFDRKAVTKTITIGLPLGLQSSITMLGCTIIQSAVNALGTVYVAAFTTAVKIENLLSTPLGSFTAATVPFVSQNYGAMKFDRIKKTLKKIFAICIGYGIVVGAVVYFFAEKIALLYINSTEAEVLKLIGYYASLTGPLFMFLCVLYAIRSYIQAMGYSLFTAIGGVVELVTRAFLAFFLISKFGYAVICLSNPISWILTDTFLILSYYIYIQRKAFTDKGAARL